MKNRTVRFTLAPLLALMVLAGCATAPAPVPALPELPQAFVESQGTWTTTTAAEAQPRGAWWKAFGDTQLDALVERARASRRELAGLEARSLALAGQARSENASRWPQVGLMADYQHLENQVLDDEDLALLGVGFSWTHFDAGRIRVDFADGSILLEAGHHPTFTAGGFDDCAALG